ncbi:unnamed protein product [Macrosiphum euphorbiae]|uniref:Uncharacterized protein n=1 Tax=Macrosiphum euphorbiae TaxID=13131 RepID=A0AAV0W8B3_9HEMI|nr:unnamed protein product [Macrosiphum euphorbiae]
MNYFYFYLWLDYKSQQKLHKSSNCVLLNNFVSIKSVRNKFILYTKLNFEEEYAELDVLKKSVMKVSGMAKPQPLKDLVAFLLRKETTFSTT